jgi:tight adherence protein C
MLFLLCLMFFTTVSLFVIGLSMRPASIVLLRDRIQHLAQPTTGGPASVIQQELGAPLSERVIRPVLLQLARLITRLTPEGQTDVLQQRLDAAGNPPRLGVREFLGLRVLSAVGGFFVALLVYRLMLTVSTPIALLCALLTLMMGVLLPDYMLQQAIGRRQYQIRKSLPDILDLLIVSVEAGLGFDGAMAKVVEKMKGPFPQELRRVLQEMQLGKARTPALKDMAARVHVQEVSTFVAAIYQADQLGVSMAKVLHVQADTMRVARSQRIREMAAKLPVKMLFPLVFFIFPAIFVIIIGPGVISIMKALVINGMGGPPSHTP